MSGYGRESGLQQLEEYLNVKAVWITFTHPDLHTNIVGTINPAHLRHNVDVLRQGPLPADVYAEAKRRLQAAGSTPRGG